MPANAARGADCVTAPNSSAPQTATGIIVRIGRNSASAGTYVSLTDRRKKELCSWARSPAGQIIAIDASGEPGIHPQISRILAYRGGDNLSEKDLEKLFTEFLEWSRHTKN